MWLRQNTITENGEEILFNSDSFPFSSRLRPRPSAYYPFLPDASLVYRGYVYLGYVYLGYVYQGNGSYSNSSEKLNNLVVIIISKHIKQNTCILDYEDGLKGLICYYSDSMMISLFHLLTRCHTIV